MNNKIRSLALSAILMLIISACGLFGNDPNNNQVIVDPPLVPAVELKVQADTATPINAVGQTVAYTYTLTNTGSVPLPGVISISGATVNCPAVNTIGNNDEFLDVGEVLTCVSSHVTTQADLDKGDITIVSVADVNGTLSNEVTTKVETIPNRKLALNKTASPTIYENVGQTITYSYTIMNTGTLDIGPAQFTVTDANSSTPINCGNADVTLAPNATVICSVSYTITQADMDANSIATEATASGGGVGPSQPASATVTKSGLVQNPANLTVGSTIQHKVVANEWLWQIARCYGANPTSVIQANPQLPNPAQISPDMVVTVPNIGAKGNIYGPPCVKLHLVQSGETWTSIAQKYNADPIVLQMVNKNIIGVGTEIKVPLNSAGGNTISLIKAVTLTMTVDPLTYSQADQVITYSYSVKNSGNTTLGPAQFSINSNLYAGALISCGGADTTLAPDASITCNSTYTINQNDMAANSVTNVATASGGGAVPSPSVSTTISKITGSISLVASASPLTYNQAGQVITYTYVIKNTGNITLGPAQFTISDSILSPNPINCGPADTTLAPEAMITCAATYTITEANLEAASIQNNPTASGGGAGPSTSSNIVINKE
ncbi:MAG TPA: LysM peptidoglycan-binding domain-containing protein [Anaerolineales bacterium]|nr:LysM peptidoglycan-binding domain-containing protein [Anaerolineales bacterium]